MGLLQLGQQKSDIEQAFADDALRAQAQQTIQKIATKSANQTEALNLIGRGVGAVNAAKNTYQEEGKPKNFNWTREIAQDYVNPYRRYSALGDTLRKMAAEKPGYQMPVDNGAPQPGPMTTLTHDNAPVVGDIMNAMHGFGSQEEQ